MGVFARPDSKFWWFWLETAAPGHERVRSDITIGTSPEDRRDSRKLADTAYHKAMLELPIHHKAPDTLRVSAGDGYFESSDADATWHDPHRRTRFLVQAAGTRV
jgi:hypothetical protein